MKIASRHAISSDGSRVFWEEATDDGEYLFLREFPASPTAEGETIEVSRGGRFQVANSEGTRAFFRLGGDLYVFEVTSGPGEPLAGQATDLTVPAKRTESADVQGEVLGASEDGSYVYFVAGAVLGDGAEHGAKPGDNLYVEHYEGTEWLAPEFIATLSGADNPDWSGGSEGGMTSRVSPNGRFVAFMSSLPLTGYDNSDVGSGEPDEEVFLYDAESGRLVCASCNPTGARPVGMLDPEGISEAACRWLLPGCLARSLAGGERSGIDRDKHPDGQIPVSVPVGQWPAVLRRRRSAGAGGCEWPGECV